jgi:GTP-binding protein EngB required for normal cell division
LITSKHVDKLLGDVESTLNAAASKTVFPNYVNDLTPVQRKTIEDYIARVRGQLLRILSGQSLAPEQPRVTAVHSTHVNLTFVDIAITELAPHYMRGYGPVSEKGAAELNGIVAELQSAVKELTRYVMQPRAADFQERVQKLAIHGWDLRDLQALAEIIDRHGLTEFRPAIGMLLDRAEDTSLEIAVFGRVSSGKSSLLNHVIGTDLLPVGVTPITAVPTRIGYGPKPLIRAWREGLGVSEHPVEELPSFVDERQNPENRKRVGRILVLYPSERLREGIVLVDTPGLGSLATSGASETLAYLPRCDAAIVLVDSSSILTGDDLKIIAALNQVSTPTTVLVSKADLLSPQDLEQQLAYTKRQLQSEYGSEVPVRAVSVVASHTHLLQQWFTDELSPLYERKQRLLQESLARKTLMLGMAVRTALDTAASQPTIANEDRARLEETDLALQRGAGTLQTFQVDLRRITDEIPLLKPLIVNKAADEIADLWVTEREVNCGEKLRTTADEVLREMTAEVRSRLEDLQTGLQRELSKAAAVLRTTDAPNAEDLHAGIEMPVFHMNRTGELASRSWVSHLGKWARVARARRELRPLENGLNEALESFSRLLCAWGLDEGAEMGTRFDSFANRYRVQLERLLIDRRRPTASQEQVKSDRERLTGMIAPDIEKPRTEAIAS